MTLFSALYLVVGVAIGLYTVMLRKHAQRTAAILYGSQLVYLFVPMVYRPALYNPYIIIGAVLVPLSYVRFYVHTRSLWLAALAGSSALIWFTWSIVLFTHGEAKWGPVVAYSAVIMPALLFVIAVARREVGNSQS